ncbi:MAG: T9SS type A sorting domain-containing protein [Candidatus Krumholzibacteriota bacterium]|nr:T9SS type A sorting domain-containing protein [Candidatus Krumholzibacteriota bacterium]
MKAVSKLLFFVLCLSLILPLSSEAATVIMNDNGFLYVVGDFPYMEPGDLLGGVGFISSTVPEINVDLLSSEMTWSISSMVVTEQFVVGSRIYTNFTGGAVKIAVDPSMNGSYELDPDISAIPTTFEDGEIFLSGTITSAYMSYDLTYQNGALVTLVNFTNGTGLAELEEPNGNIVEFTFGPDDPNIPDGFSLQAIGQISAPALCTVGGNVSFIYNPATCQKCLGITRLALEYSGSGDLSSVVLTGGVQYEVFGNLLVLTPCEFDEYLPGNTKISIGCEDTDIHTSCSRPIQVGNVIDDFTVTDVQKVIIPCEDANCDGIVKLVLEYIGTGDPSTVTVSDGAVATVEGNIITITATEAQLHGNTTIAVGCDAVTIHTSCSQPLEEGFVFEDFVVLDVEEFFCPGGDDYSATSGPVVGVTVDIVDGEGNTHSTLTDESGNYHFFDVATDSIAVSVIVPLGYYPESPTEVDIVCQPGDHAVVDFLFERLATQDCPRSTGFWKHQITCALQGKQKGVQVPADLLLEYFVTIHSRFDQYFEIFIPVVTLEDFSSIFSLKKPTMYEKARKEFAGLLLNVVSGRLSSWQFISTDQATVSQAITFISQLLVDDNPSNDELAKDIAEMLNHDEIVAAGLIPLDIDYIAYRRGNDTPGAVTNVSNFPNPFNPMTTISYEIENQAPVTIAVYNVAGQRIKTLVSNIVQSGFNTVQWDGRDSNGDHLSSGIYFYSIKAGNETVTRRMVLLR